MLRSKSGGALGTKASAEPLKQSSGSAAVILRMNETPGASPGRGMTTSASTPLLPPLPLTRASTSIGASRVVHLPTPTPSVRLDFALPRKPKNSTITGLVGMHNEHAIECLQLLNAAEGAGGMPADEPGMGAGGGAMRFVRSSRR